MYGCALIDEVSNQCLQWVALGPFGLPPLSIEQGSTLGGAVMLAAASIWGIRVLASALK